MEGAKVDWNGTPESNPLDAGLEVGIGRCENDVGANVFWNGLLLGPAVAGANVLWNGLLVGPAVGPAVAGANVLWNGLLEGPAVGPGVGLGANVEGKGLLDGLAVGLGRGVLGAKVLLGNEVSNGGVVGLELSAGLLDGPGRGLFGLGLIGCLPGFGDWKGLLSIGKPLPLPITFKEFPNAGRPLPPDPPNALPCLPGGLENPLPLPPPNTFPTLPPVPPHAGTSHGQLQIKFTSSKAKPNGHLNS